MTSPALLYLGLDIPSISEAFAATAAGLRHDAACRPERVRVPPGGPGAPPTRRGVAMTTAIIGVGNIGGAVARHLVAGGESVVLAATDHERTASRR
jgi:phosphoglycerate dehydrogenase-like enzyme